MVINAVAGVEVVRVGVPTIEEIKMVMTYELKVSTFKIIGIQTEKVMDVAVEVCVVDVVEPTQLTESQILFLKTVAYWTKECLHMTLIQM